MSGMGTVGSGIIIESFNELFAMRNILYTREFNWKNYATQKAMSMAMTVGTLGFSQIKNAGKAVHNAAIVAMKTTAEKGLIQSAKCAFTAPTLKLFAKNFAL